jgi:polyhydroxyalkanoate synthesis repressor PhaR
MVVMQAQRKHQVRLIKRYGNRKLYDVRRSRYITLDGIRALVQEGDDIRVVDNDTGEDLTAVTFAQIIYESAKRTGEDGAASAPLLRWLIQRGDEAVRELRHGVEVGRDAIESVREAAGRGVQKLVGAGGGGSRRRSLLEEILDAPERRLSELQRRIDQQIRQSVERVTRHPALRGEIERVESSIRRLEKRLGRLTGSSSSTARRRSAKVKAADRTRVKAKARRP